MSTVMIETRTCLVCGKDGQVEVPLKGYMDWRAGAFIQDAMPDVSAAEREQIITGTHGSCWDKMMDEEER